MAGVLRGRIAPNSSGVDPVQSFSAPTKGKLVRPRQEQLLKPLRDHGEHGPGGIGWSAPTSPGRGGMDLLRPLLEAGWWSGSGTRKSGRYTLRQPSTKPKPRRPDLILLSRRRAGAPMTREVRAAMPACTSTPSSAPTRGSSSTSCFSTTSSWAGGTGSGEASRRCLSSNTTTPLRDAVADPWVHRRRSERIRPLPEIPLLRTQVRVGALTGSPWCSATRSPHPFCCSRALAENGPDPRGDKPKASATFALLSPRPPPKPGAPASVSARVLLTFQGIPPAASGRRTPRILQIAPCNDCFGEPSQQGIELTALQTPDPPLNPDSLGTRIRRRSTLPSSARSTPSPGANQLRELGLIPTSAPSHRHRIRRWSLRAGRS